VNGRKRHLLVDTLGLIQAVVVHEADFQDPEGAWFLIAKMVGRFPRLQKMWADGRYKGLVATMGRLFGCDLEIVSRSPQARGFSVLPKRWIVERTFGWLGRYRRLTREYEEQPASSEAMIYLAMSHLMVRRLRPA
jgi:putative transposase